MKYVKKSLIESTIRRIVNENVESSNPKGDFLLRLLQIRDQSHIFHWQTESYAQHKAFGKFYENYLDKIDDLAEQIFGKMEGFYLEPSGSLSLVDYSDDNLTNFIDDACQFFRTEMMNVVPVEGNEEIYNTVEEVLSLMNKLKYLLTLR